MSMVFVSPRVGIGKADGLFILALPQNESKGLEMANSSVEPALSPSAT
ncbi:MAG: hypothetical protein AAGI23_18710 [Bacteroidota bacterium]